MDMDTETFAAVARRRFRPIAGSRLLQGQCTRCGQPMRVTVEDAAKSLADDRHRILCLDCLPGGGGSYGGSPQSRADNAYHGGRYHSAEWEG